MISPELTSMMGDAIVMVRYGPGVLELRQVYWQALQGRCLQTFEPCILIALSIAIHAVLVDSGVHGTVRTVTAVPGTIRRHLVSDERIENRKNCRRSK